MGKAKRIHSMKGEHVEEEKDDWKYSTEAFRKHNHFREVEPWLTQPKLRIAIMEENRRVLEENRAKILKRARKRLELEQRGREIGHESKLRKFLKGLYQRLRK